MLHFVVVFQHFTTAVPDPGFSGFVSEVYRGKKEFLVEVHRKKQVIRVARRYQEASLGHGEELGRVKTIRKATAQDIETLPRLFSLKIMVEGELVQLQ